MPGRYGIVVVEGKVNLRALPLKPSLRYDLLRLFYVIALLSLAQSHASASNAILAHSRKGRARQTGPALPVLSGRRFSLLAAPTLPSNLLSSRTSR